MPMPLLPPRRRHPRPVIRLPGNMISLSKRNSLRCPTTITMQPRWRRRYSRFASRRKHCRAGSLMTCR
ncbi:MAG: hypothetical protein WC483_00405 [Candidatus Paceibacterota bacterium]